MSVWQLLLKDGYISPQKFFLKFSNATDGKQKKIGDDRNIEQLKQTKLTLIEAKITYFN